MIQAPDRLPRNLLGQPLASIVGSLFVRVGDRSNLGAALHAAWIAAILTAVGAVVLSLLILGPVPQVEQPLYLAGAIIGGLVAGLAIGWLSEYFLRPPWSGPAHRRSGANRLRHGDPRGLATGMRSTAPSVG